MCKTNIIMRMCQAVSTACIIHMHIDEDTRKHKSDNFFQMCFNCIYLLPKVMLFSICPFGRSGPLNILTKMCTPSSPQHVRRSSNRGAKHAKLRWNEPSYNSESVTHYRVKYHVAGRTYHFIHDTKKRTPRDKKKPKLSAVIRGLEPNTDYVFCVQSLNDEIEGGCSGDIWIDTRWSKAAKVAVTPAVMVGATLATPFVSVAGAANAVWDRIEPKNPLTGLLTSVASVGAGLLAGVASVLASPFVGVAAAVELHDEDVDSLQSSEEI